MHLPRRRTVWISIALFLAIVVGASFFAPRSRTHEYFDKINEKMHFAEVESILGQSGQAYGYVPDGVPIVVKHDERPMDWTVIKYDPEDGPDSIYVLFVDDRVARKHIHLATTLETFAWYAKKGAKRIGIKWQ